MEELFSPYRINRNERVLLLLKGTTIFVIHWVIFKGATTGGRGRNKRGMEESVHQNQKT